MEISGETRAQFKNSAEEKVNDEWPLSSVAIGNGAKYHCSDGTEEECKCDGCRLHRLRYITAVAVQIKLLTIVDASLMLNCFWREPTLSEVEKKSIASHVQASHPVRKCTHWSQVRLASTVMSGMLSCRSSRRGTRLRRKYGAIACPYVERPVKNWGQGPNGIARDAKQRTPRYRISKFRPRETPLSIEVIVYVSENAR
jgi:hypothetical protein